MSFNPRTRESATGKPEDNAGTKRSFNPRTRESATSENLTTKRKEIVSIHALVRVRLVYRFREVGGIVFQSTHS